MISHDGLQWLFLMTIPVFTPSNMIWKTAVSEDYILEAVRTDRQQLMGKGS